MSNTKQPEADGESELRQQIIEYQLNAFDNLTRNEFKSIALPEMMQTVNKLIHLHDQARDAQQLAAVLEKRPEKLATAYPHKISRPLSPDGINQDWIMSYENNIGWNLAVDQYDSAVRAVLKGVTSNGRYAISTASSTRGYVSGGPLLENRKRCRVR